MHYLKSSILFARYNYSFGFIKKIIGLLLSAPLACLLACVSVLQISHAEVAGLTTSDSPDTSQYTRVEEGLIAFYPFNEGSGSVVTDQSGTGQPLDLEIEDEDEVAWLPCGGLRTQKKALIASTLPATKIKEAVEVSREITLEAWVAPEKVHHQSYYVLLNLEGA